MRRLHWISLPMLLVAAVLLTACEEGNPVAPPGTILTLTASPSRISLNGQAQIVVEGRRPDGNRLPEGTEVRLSTTLGSLAPLIAEIDSAGRATAVLQGDGRSGTATVSATTGTGAEGGTEATVEVLIGESPETAPQLTVSANPSEVPLGETSTITVVARQTDGSPLGAGETVLLTTTLGSLNPQRPLTDQGGVATATLNAGDQAGQAEVTAILGASEPATTTVTLRDAAFEILLTANSSTIGQNGGDIELSAFVTNAQGEGFPGARVVFNAPVGTFNPGSVIPTDNLGVAETTLTVDDAEVDADDVITVTATTSTASGENIQAQLTITVTAGSG